MRDFKNIRDDYIAARLEQRTILIQLMEENHFKVTKNGKAGKGNKYYGKNKFDPLHDLRHHQWIEARTDDAAVHFLISLNPFEIDSNTGNPHHLYDRIGVQAYLGDKNWESSHRTAMIITKWSLPLSPEESKDFLKYLNNLVKWFKYWEEISEQ